MNTLKTIKKYLFKALVLACAVVLTIGLFYAVLIIGFIACVVAIYNAMEKYNAN